MVVETNNSSLLLREILILFLCIVTPCSLADGYKCSRANYGLRYLIQADAMVTQHTPINSYAFREEQSSTVRPRHSQFYILQGVTVQTQTELKSGRCGVP
jgi:hypothetical protein